jgi:glutamine phosphoribosylpyrophosphate amidotransferase
MEDTNGKLVHTNFIGRTFVDANALLRDPKVRRTLEKLSKANRGLRGRPGITFLRPRKTEG